MPSILCCFGWSRRDWKKCEHHWNDNFGDDNDCIAPDFNQFWYHLFWFGRFFLFGEQVSTPIGEIEKCEHHWEDDSRDDIDSLTACGELGQPTPTAVVAGLR